MSTKKYRPYFTLSELEEIYNALTQMQSNLNLELRRYIGKYINDIRDGYRVENHTLKPSLEEKLGFSTVGEYTPTTKELEELQRYLLEQTSTIGETTHEPNNH